MSEKHVSSQEGKWSSQQACPRETCWNWFVYLVYLLIQLRMDLQRVASARIDLGGEVSLNRLVSQSNHIFNAFWKNKFNPPNMLCLELLVWAVRIRFAACQNGPFAKACLPFLVVLVPIGSIGIQSQVTTKGVVFGKKLKYQDLWMTKVSHFLEHLWSPEGWKYIKRVSV